MADEGNAGAPEGSEKPPAPDASAPLIDAEGNLREGWQSILDEDMRDSSYLKEVKTLQGMAKSTVSARSMVGADKIVIPTEASTPEMWDSYYKAGGRPDTAEDYAFAKPDDLPDEFYDAEYVKGIQDVLFKYGGSKKLADALFAFDNEYKMNEIARIVSDEETAATTLKDGLYADWGNAYEQRKHMGDVAVEHGVNGDEEFKERLLNKFGNDPDFIRYSSNLGSKFTESSSPDVRAIPTVGDIQEQIDKEQASPAYGTDYAKHGFTKAQHRAQVNKVQRLFNQKMASETKTGVKT
jgi:hypothetical protein